MAETFPEDDALELIPADDSEAISADQELDSAEAALLDDPFEAAEIDKPPIPFGRTLSFNYETGQFRRVGGTAAAWVYGEDALREWIYATVRTAAGAHPIYDETFGFEDPDSMIGLTDPAEAMADFERRTREALLVHDRILGVEDLDAEHQPEQGVISVHRIVVVTDEEQAVELSEFDVEPSVP